MSYDEGDSNEMQTVEFVLVAYHILPRDIEPFGRPLIAISFLVVFTGEVGAELTADPKNIYIAKGSRGYAGSSRGCL